MITKLERLIYLINRLPGVGKRGSENIANNFICNKEDALELANQIKEVVNNVFNCKFCNSFTEGEVCLICDDDTRDKNTICVIANETNLFKFEDMEIYKGLYFVLNEEISLKFKNELLSISKLFKMINKNKSKEIIIATNPTIQGELTAKHIIKTLKPLKLKISRLAYGLSIGSEIEYIDKISLKHSFLNRRKI